MSSKIKKLLSSILVVTILMNSTPIYLIATENSKTEIIDRAVVSSEENVSGQDITTDPSISEEASKEGSLPDNKDSGTSEEETGSGQEVSPDTKDSGTDEKENKNEQETTQDTKKPDINDKESKDDKDVSSEVQDPKSEDLVESNDADETDEEIENTDSVDEAEKEIEDIDDEDTEEDSNVNIFGIINSTLSIDGLDPITYIEPSSLHFIIRHWHAVSNPENNSTDDNKQTVLEGYIIPNGNGYGFYKDRKRSEKLAQSSQYTMNTSTGTIEIKAFPYKNEVDLESFSGFSISAGHDAVSTNSSNSLTITYKSNIHLVKSHIFYIGNSNQVIGSSAEILFEEKSEKDSANVYVYLNDGNDHSKDDIVVGIDGKPVFEDAKNLPENLIEGVDVALSKVYNTTVGLHTDKTITSVGKDERTFDLDLEAWYSSNANANVGFILDASGSMAFSANSLNVMNISDSELGLDAETINKLKSRSISNYVADGKVDWDKTFLTEDELKLILDPHNTDNSRLGVSGYSYYIYDSRTSTKDFTPIGYWDVSTLKPVFQDNNLIGYYTFDKGSYNDTRRDWLLNSITGKNAKKVKKVSLGDESFSFTGVDANDGWPNQPFSMSATTGYDITKGYDVDGDGILEIEGMLLDAKPSTSDFTISFNITKQNTNTDNSPEKEILYIGSLNESSQNYIAVRRPGNSSIARLKAFNGEKQVSNANNIFNTTTKKRITYVFKGNTIKTFVDGVYDENSGIEDINLSDYNDINIIFNAFEDNYSGSSIYIDDVYIFDKALSDGDVAKLIDNPFETTEGNIAKNKDGSISGTVKDYFLPSKNRTSLTGWYYVSHGNTDLYLNENIQTAKTLYGIPGKTDLVYEDNVIIPDNGVVNSKGIEVTGGGTKYTYTPKSDINTPLLFYIDDNGYIRCFWAANDLASAIGASYVYNLSDSDYVRVESLQRALGSFVTKLNESSPSSKVSAVRYSASSFQGNYDKLVLLDWTNDPSESSSILSLKRGNGEGKSLDYTISKTNGLKQYNYGLTGGTDVLSGLQAFKQYLLPNDEDSAKKYIVIFTDGSDENVNSPNEPVKIANELKDAGYTIYAILLSSGTVSKGTVDYNNAKAFLTKLTGNEKNVYTTDILENSGSTDKSEALFNTVDTLVNVFTGEVLSDITNDLTGYNVQDYIDPRFDLVSASGQVCHLNGDGKVIIENEEYDLLNGTQTSNNLTIGTDAVRGYYLNITVTNFYGIDTHAKVARLYYDNTKNMYYLIWTNQDINGSDTNAKRITTWKSRITLRAKDDFIGGNAVLTNGNSSNMNYIYHPADSDYSSGTKNALKEGNNHPSKGLPRVTANVKLISGNEIKEEQIYLGETLNLKSLIEKTLTTNNKENNTYYFLEYFERYESITEGVTDNIINALMAGKTYEIPYMYLPNKDKSNQTGTELNKKDILGYWKYEIVNSSGVGSVITDKTGEKLALKVVYEPLPIEAKLNSITRTQEVKDRKSALDILVDDSFYKWDNEYKLAAGSEQNENSFESRVNTKVVSGEIALQLILNQEVVTVLRNDELTYTLDLVRNYNGKKEKVGTFIAKYKDGSIKPREDGNVIVTASLKYNETYMETNGLPIGIYTVENPQATYSKSINIDFGLPSVITDKKQYTEDLFKLGTDYKTPQSYIAKFGDNKIILGEVTEDDYTNYRFGLLQLTPTAMFELPEAGSRSLVNICLVTVNLIIVAYMLEWNGIYIGKHSKLKGGRRYKK